MIELTGGAGFLLEAAQTVVVRRECRRQNLYGDVAAQAVVARAIHLAHRPGADQRKDLVDADPLSDHQR